MSHFSAKAVSVAVAELKSQLSDLPAYRPHDPNAVSREADNTAVLVLVVQDFDGQIEVDGFHGQPVRGESYYDLSFDKGVAKITTRISLEEN